MSGESSLNVIDIDINLIVPNDVNVNTMTERELQRLSEELRDTGIISPITVVPLNDGKYKILGGEHRWKAARLAGYTKVPSVILTDEKWEDDDIFDLTAFKLNAIHGSIDQEKFVKLYRRMADKFGADKLQHVLAVTDDEAWRKITRDIKKQLQGRGIPASVIKKIMDAGDQSKTLDHFSKNITKILRKHSENVDHNNVVFSAGGREHIVVAVSEDVFSIIRRLHETAHDRGYDFASLISNAIINASKELVK